MTKTLCTENGERLSDILDLIHTNVCGPISTQVKGRYSYIIFTNDICRFGYVYLMKYKFEAFDKFKEHQKIIEK